jgi:hypothetical protein
MVYTFWNRYKLRHHGFRTRFLFIFILLFVSFSSGVFAQEKKVNDRKIEQERKKKNRKAEKEYNQAVKQHYKNQSKETRKQMKQTDREARKTRKPSRGKAKCQKG